ncbi:MAG TPA: DUF2905 domain-containing protein [bacterium]|nr:DUF2905 domain-containing protein [bacterium]
MMAELNPIGKFLILLGGILVGLGVMILFIGKLPWLGRLPGDIFIQKKNFSFFFPVTTSIFLSFILSLILYLFSRR